MSLTTACCYAITSGPPSETAPWWAIPVAVVIGTVLTLTGSTTEWRRWRNRDAVPSWRLRGLRNLLTRAWLATLVLVALALPSAALGDATKGTVVSAVLLGGILLVGALQVAVVLGGRAERRIDDAILRHYGLPIRRTYLPWWIVGLLCYVGGPFAMLAISPILSLPLSLLGDTAEIALSVVIALLMVLGWIAGSFGLTVRQWLRQRQVDRSYWPAYRQALREHGGTIANQRL